MLDIQLPEPAPRTFLLFVQTSDAVVKHADAALFHYGLSAVKLMVLQILASQGGSLTPGAIALLAQREPHTISTLVQRLKRQGLIKVGPSAKDRRSKVVSLTPKARKLLEQVRPAAGKIAERVMASLDGTHLKSLEESLRVMWQNARDGSQ